MSKIKLTPEIVSKFMSAMGKRGGKVKSEAKSKASRLNGKLGGRPRKKNKQND